MKYTKAIIFSVVIVIAILTLVGVRYMSYNNTKKEMLNYLKDKYGVEFEEVFYEKGATFFKELYGNDKMIVRSKENKELYCTVFNNSDGDGFSDNYVTAVLSKKFTDLNYEKISKLDNRVKIFNFGLYTNIRINKKETLKTDVNEFIQMQNNLEIVFYLGIVCESEPNKVEESKLLYEVYSVMKSLQKQYNRNFTVEVGYIKPEIYEKAKMLSAVMPIYDVMWSDLGKKNIYYQIRFDQSDNADSYDYFIDKFKNS